jgi:hypothetical protein
MCGTAQKIPVARQKITPTVTPLRTVGEIVVRAEQSIIVVRKNIAVFIVMLAGSAFIPWLDNAADFETTDIGSYLSRMVSVPLALAGPPGAASVTSQPLRADLQALVNEHLALRDSEAQSSPPLSCP